MTASRSKFSLVFSGGVLLLAAAAVLSSPARIRQGLHVVWLKTEGSLPDVTWTDLISMSRPGNHFNLPKLAATPNPYSVIHNMYDSASDVGAGSTLFRSHCAECHGDSGHGGSVGPDLRGRHMVQGSSDWAIYRTVSFGIPKTAMPGSNLSWADKWRLVAYVKSLMPLSETAISTEGRIPGLKAVSYEDIRSGVPGDWLTYSGSYDGHRFSTLNQITPANAGGLRLLWMRQYDTSEQSIETNPIVVSGYMFVTAPPNRVEALDAKTGTLIWSYDRQLPDHLSLCCGYVNRGLAVLGNSLFFGTLDAHLVALDISTGQVRWDVEIADHKNGYSITGAPLVLRNLVITGIAGGEYGIRGFVDARDPETGKEVWRCSTVPSSGQPGTETWQGDSWKTGGVPTWVTGSFDPSTNLLYWPTGNPGPDFEGDARKGDNLYSSSALAINADNGSIRWHFQFTPHNVFDWDATEVLILIDGAGNGKTRRYITQADRNGFYYVLNADDGQFLSATPFAKETWADKIDTHGRPVVRPDVHPTKQGTLIYPGAGGGANWEPPSFSPATGLFYVSALDGGAVFVKDHDDYHPGEFFLSGTTQHFPNLKPQGAIRALNAMTGELKWEVLKSGSAYAGLLSTQGGLVFGGQGETFLALDAATGQQLWQVETGGHITAAPISFACDGKQLISIAAGHDLLTFGL